MTAENVTEDHLFRATRGRNGGRNGCAFSDAGRGMRKSRKKPKVKAAIRDLRRLSPENRATVMRLAWIFLQKQERQQPRQH